MLKTWRFWKSFFIAYVALVTGIWGFLEAATYFGDDTLRQMLGSNWWLVYFLPLLIAFSFAARQNAKEEAPAEALDQRNRRVMLDHVENFWVRGVLEKSLHGAALLELGIKEDPDALNYHWTIKKESTNEILPAGKSMLEIFHEIGLGRSLLILGAPGSGKTTMLLELARQLIKGARKNKNKPIPVVFNLASWTEKQTLADWLEGHLNLIYRVPKKTASAWVSANQILLLLDGLDEVKEEHRSKCVEAINQFRKEHGLTSLAVCSRLTEYSAIAARLSFDGAIALQPLTSEQINAYIDGFGKSLAAVKRWFGQDKALQELSETPLMLSIIALAYKDIKADKLPASEGIEDLRKHLFEAYIERMFDRSTRSANSPFTKQQTLHYLNWLAGTMIRHNLVTYQLESMQPSWCENQRQLRQYRWLTGLWVGLSLGLSLGLSFWLIWWLTGGLGIGLIGGLGIGLIGGLIGGLGFGGLDSITMYDRLNWSWREIWSALIIYLIGGLILGLIGELTNLLLGWLLGGPDFGLSDGLLLGLGFWLMVGLLSGLHSAQIETATHFGQRIMNTLSSALVAGLSGLVMALFGGLISGSKIDLNTALMGGLFLGPILGLPSGLIYGFGSILQHYSLRSVLTKHDMLPRSRQLIPFLEYSVSLIFLRRVGGSYIFIHRLLMEHFAEMEV